MPILKDEIAEAGVEALLLIGLDGFNLADPAITEFVTNRTRLLGDSVNKETDKQLRAELAEGINAGESVPELMARIERVYGAAAGYRAERIARTETIRAESYASQAAWQQSGLVEKKEWYTAKDERVCEYCGPMNGRVVTLDALYFEDGDTYTGASGGTLKVSYGDVDGPPLHVSCRCTLLPVL